MNTKHQTQAILNQAQAIREIREEMVSELNELEGMNVNMNVTKGQLERVTRDWSAIAGEPLKIEATTISEPVYAFGSELGVLRLFKKMGTGRAEFSKNLNTFYYVNK